MKHSTLYNCLLGLILLTACSDHPLTPDAPRIEGTHEVTVAFSAPAADTRSYLTGSEVDYKNIQTVMLYIFHRWEGTTDYVAYDSEPVSEWNGNISVTHRLSTLLPDGDFMFVAVGCDKESADTYRFDWVEDQNDADGINGTVLEAFKATLKEADLKGRMAYCDFYEGSASASLEMIKSTRVEIVMYRQVAGVIVYLKNIPTEFNALPVNRLQVSLPHNQSSEVFLCKQTPYGTTTAPGSEVLIEYVFKPEEIGEDGVFHPAKPRIPTGETDKDGNPVMETVETVDGSLFVGAFLLPWRKGDAGLATLQIKLINDESAGQGQPPLKVYTIKYKVPLLNADGTPSTNPDGTVNTEVRQDFDLEANHLYSVGKKLSKETTDGDEPYDLTGSPLEIIVDPIDADYKVDVEFPQVSQPPMLSTNFDSLNYVYDCINQFIEVRIDSAYPTKKVWKLEVVDYESENEYSDMPNPWCHIRIPDAGTANPGDTLKQVYEGSKEAMTIRVKLDDFVEENYYTQSGVSVARQIMNDKRSCKLKLTDEDGNVQYLPIVQYNAICIPVTKEQNKECPYPFGIPRLDFNAKFDPATGNYDPASYWEISWGFFQTTADNIFDVTLVSDVHDNDGVALIQRGMHSDHAPDLGGWVGSMFYYVEGSKTYNQGRYTRDTSLPCWFVPAREQGVSIEQFITTKGFTVDEIDSVFNFKADQFYWSMSMSSESDWNGGNWAFKAKAYFPVKDRITTPGSHRLLRRTSLPVRQARHYEVIPSQKDNAPN